MQLPRILLTVSALALAAPAYGQAVNTSQVNQTGTNNQANVDNNVPGNLNDSSVVVQNGASNSASIYQRAILNRSFVQQVGTLNNVTHEQVGNSNSNETRQSGNFDTSTITQIGDLNSATVAQVGFYNNSVVRQGYELPSGASTGELRAANGNRASVDQNGAGLRSTVLQRAASTSSPPASDNVASVVQRSDGTTDLVQQVSSITQESRGNSASVSQTGGSVNAVNTATIAQRTTSAASASLVAANTASVTQSGSGQSGLIQQNGMRDSATISMQTGGENGAGNLSSVTQAGDDLYAQLSVGAANGVGGRANRSSVGQSGRNHSITGYQFGTGDASTVNQTDGPAAAVYATGVQRGAVFLSQNGIGDVATVNQAGDNNVDLTQGFGTGSVTGVSQVDAGDLGATRALNSAAIAQYGTGNAINVSQNSVGASATAWQRVGSSSNTIDVRQGTGETSLPSTTATQGFTGGPTGGATSGLSASVTQSAVANLATVYQDGTNLTAAVEQLGSGSGSLRNKVFVSQTGTNNYAKASQAASVGQSAAGDPASGYSASQNAAAGRPTVADEFYFAGGARSAEIAILQTNTGNSATVSQSGKGQFARIEQSGAVNTASIVQDAQATNATAVIRQLGQNNSYSVVQSSPGQYVVVTQTGQGNTVTSVVSRP